MKREKVEFVNASQKSIDAAKTVKSRFQRSRFNNGMVLNITGYGWTNRKVDGTVDEDSAFPVLHTTLNGQPFDNIFLSTLVRPDQSYDGMDVPKTGSFNALAIKFAEDASVPNDEVWMQRIQAELAGRSIRVNRINPVDPTTKQKITAMVFGQERPMNQLNFDIV